ncbi:YecA family protein [Psychromonas sp. Urea-02u-13]|uniref:YecA family protein n=1 Tax=Psychromonas sp. Urea-02u-13 TaxID=2058326 RepID=UPI000C348D05|nr:SEC-C domain-containing protein [Psychromonas sp. Urea-02u-13]PKG38942.1 SecC motif-containing protein [Psychromonas sp. Urea-02u-13]
MKLKRNDPCACGSGIKYKKCCMNSGAVETQNIAHELQNIVAMNPDLSLEDLQVVLEHKVDQQNNRAIDNYCGLSPEVMHSWIHDDCSNAVSVTFTAPKISAFDSPLLAYVEIILTDILDNMGKLKATPKGNLPTKTVKKASLILSNLAVAKYETMPSISEFTGSNEDKFAALHATRILLQHSGFIKLQKGYFSLTKKGEGLYQKQGLNGFFVPLLQYYIEKYNWGYLDGYSDHVMISMCWAFSFWRLQEHGSVEQLCEEVNVAFPWLETDLPVNTYCTQKEELKRIIEVRLISRFMILFGFAIVDPRQYQDGEKIPVNLTLLPLFSQVIKFDI